MRTWDQLNKAERSIVLERTKSLLLDLIVDGVIEVDMPNVEARKVFSQIIKGMRQTDNRDTRIASLYSDKFISKELEKLVKAAAQGASYEDNSLTIMELQ